MKKNWPWGVLAAVVIAVVAFAIWTSVGAAAARKAALAEVDRVEVKRVEAERRANVLADSLELEQERTAVVLGHLEEQKQRADSALAVLALETAVEASVALETGEDLGQTLRTAREAATGPLGELLDTAQVQLEDHLAADLRTVEGFRLQIRTVSEARAFTERETMEWKALANLAEEALGAREVECQICSSELALLRDIKDPGFLERALGKAKTIGLTVAGTLLVVLVVL